MAVFIGWVVLNVSDSRRAGEFWSGGLGYVPQSTNSEFLVPPEWRPPSNSRFDHRDGMHLHVDSCDKTHLDLWVDHRSDPQTEVERLVYLGARRVDWEYPEGADFVVRADTEGNLFCAIP